MLKKIGNIVLDIIFLVFIILAIIMIMLSINSNKDGISSFMGLSPFSVKSNSMEPTIMSGDLIFVKQVKNNESLEKNDIISYFVMDKNDKIVLTSRIVEVRKTENMTSYLTQGDNEETPNENEVAPGDIVGVYTGTKISKLGSVYNFLSSRNGFLICIIIPLFIFFVFQFRKFIKTFKEINGEEKN